MSAQALAGAQPCEDGCGSLAPGGVMADERDTSLVVDLPGLRLGDVMQQRAPPQRLPACQLVGERQREELAGRLCVSSEEPRRITLQFDRLIDDRQGVLID